MSNPLEASPPTAPPRHRFQFSLGTLFLFSMLFGVCCAGIFNPYNWVRDLTLLAVQAVLFYVYLTWWIYARGYLRTFSIGATISFLFPWMLTAYFWFAVPTILISSNSPGDIEAQIFGTATLSDGIVFLWQSILAFIMLFDSLFIGGTMVFARWLIDRSRRKEAEAENSVADAVAGCKVECSAVE